MRLTRAPGRAAVIGPTAPSATCTPSSATSSGYVARWARASASTALQSPPRSLGTLLVSSPSGATACRWCSGQSWATQPRLRPSSSHGPCLARRTLECRWRSRSTSCLSFSIAKASLRRATGLSRTPSATTSRRRWIWTSFDQRGRFCPSLRRRPRLVSIDFLRTGFELYPVLPWHWGRLPVVAPKGRKRLRSPPGNFAVYCTVRVDSWRLHRPVGGGWDMPMPSSASRKKYGAAGRMASAS
mmetsp:Transcript_3133/g.6755  ORF Transcript_3133/g.6755 Transcript_3133/m.6755 type:complete len:242 (+) Transcript_3133:849-1574(+)